MSEHRYYVTTPIYYVNDKPHIGHAYTTIAADVLARHHRSKGESVFFLTGVDEHGQKVERAARERGVTAQQQCDEMSERFRELWPKLGIEPSAFIRTTDAAHKAFVTARLAELKEKGFIEARDFEGWYCTPCERYWTEKDLVEGKCPDCRREVALLKEKNYFFLMSRFADPLKRVIASGELRILPTYRRNEVLGFLEKGLGDLCISRPKSRLAWGIPLPFDPEYVTYVWVDALLNYVSSTTYLAGGDASRWPASLHLIGKDILTTHAVYWPTILMALGLPLPRALGVHGWWTVEGEKMSKSVGNVVAPAEWIAEYAGGDRRAAVDALRYFLMAEMTFGADGDFSRAAFEKRWTSDLSNDVGNLVSRVTALVGQLCGGRVASLPDAADRRVIADYEAALDECQFNRAIEAVLAYVRGRNQFLQQAAPWSHKEQAAEILGKAVAGLRLTAVLLAPFIPESAREIARRLGLDDVPPLGAALEPFTASARKGEPLFARPEARKEEKKKMPEEKPAAAAADNQITIDDFKRVELRVGLVKAAEKVPGADKLLKLEVDIGTETRTLVAGIAKSYTPEELVGKSVVVVVNLKPAKLRGIESRGMLLAGTSPDPANPDPIILSPLSPLPPGSVVR